MAEDVKVIDGTFTFNIKYNDVVLNNVKLPMGGRHNILNFLAAFTTGCLLGLEPATLAKAIFNFKGDNFNYGSAPYLGISMPFGREGVTKPFWSNLSISAGAFILDFKDVDDKKVTGPIFKRPTYLGMGYKVYKFIKLNAAVAFLEDADQAGVTGFKNSVEFRPMIGLSAEFNFWMDLAK